MKQIINGIVYDTETAALVAHRPSDYPSGHHLWLDETLYRTEDGHWFLVGEGSGWRHSFGEGKHIRAFEKAWFARHYLQRINGGQAALDRYFPGMRSKVDGFR